VVLNLLIIELRADISMELSIFERVPKSLYLLFRAFSSKKSVNAGFLGKRLMLRGIGLNDRELNILGIKAAGE
jgi:hypothetical protein